MHFGLWIQIQNVQLMSAIFSRIYSYRQRPDRNSLENYLTEIFAYCLEKDATFFRNTLEYWGISYGGQPYSVKTQVTDPELGRPDIEISFDDTDILIESKIEHRERPHQLRDYLDILKRRKAKHKHLLYLTKYREYKSINQKGITYHHHCWYEVAEQIRDDHAHPITLELKHFLKDKDMAESKNFNYQDLAALKTISATINKMDAVLNGVGEYFAKHFGKWSKDSSRSTSLQKNSYQNFKEFIDSDGYKYWIHIGFMWWWEEIYLGAYIYLSANESNKHKKYAEVFKGNFENLEVDEWDNGSELFLTTKLTDYFDEDGDQIPEMIKYLKELIDTLAKVKAENPQMFGQ